MHISEHERNDLYQSLRETLGDQSAETLMQYLPTAGFGDLATKADLRATEVNVGVRMDAMEDRILGLMRHELRVQLLAIVAIAVALSGLVLRFG